MDTNSISAGGEPLELLYTIEQRIDSNELVVAVPSQWAVGANSTGAHVVTTRIQKSVT